MKKKIKIRKGIFETNSSSAHSFSIGQGDKFTLGDLQVSPEGIIEVSSGDWPRKTNDVSDKLGYLLSYAFTIAYDDKKLWRHWRDIIFKVVKEFSGAKKIKFDANDVEEIDHQSTDIIDRRDLENPEFIKRFIFSENSWLYVIWDSEDPGEGFYEDVHGETKVIYTLRFVLPGYKTIDVPVSYKGSENLDNLLDDAFDDIYYNPETQGFEYHSSKIDPKTFQTPKIPDKLWSYLRYTDDESIFSWGNRDQKIEVLPEVILNEEG